jgi:hypothetical protein
MWLIHMYLQCYIPFIRLQKHRLGDHECCHLGMALQEEVAVQSLK